MKISTVIPTFNEFQELGRCISRLQAQKCRAEIEILVVNAGEPLPPDLAEYVEELRVPGSCFWTASVDAGFAAIEGRDSDLVLLLNADTELLDGSIEALLEVVSKDPLIIACCPAYTLDEEGRISLLYSDDVMVPFFLHNYLKRSWKLPVEAPVDPYPVSSIGGQGVLFHRKLIAQQRMDSVRFPHYRGDQDFWIRAKKLGYRLIMVPQAGIINSRPFGSESLSRWQRLRKIPYLFGSPRSRDSWRTVWNLHRKHQVLPVATLSFAIYFPCMVVYRVLQLVKSRVI